MSCEVYLYDDTMAPLPSKTIEIVESDRGGTTIDLQLSTRRGPSEYGASLATPIPARPVNILVDDRSRTRAPTRLGDLNGMVNARLDVALYPLPSPGGGSGGGRSNWPGGGPMGGNPVDTQPDTPDEIASLVQQRVNDGDWGAEEAEGVLRLVLTAIWALGCLSADADLKTRLARWLEQLEHLGIRLTTTKKHGGGGSNPSRKPEAKYFGA